MSLSGPARRAVAAALGVGALAGALLGVAPLASAQPLPPPNIPGVPLPPAPPLPPGAPLPANCTAGDLAQVSAIVSANTSVYLFQHPDVNAFFTSLKGQPKADIKDDVLTYLDAHPQTKTDLTGIRQPLIDLRDRC